VGVVGAVVCAWVFGGLVVVGFGCCGWGGGGGFLYKGELMTLPRSLY